MLVTVCAPAELELELELAGPVPGGLTVWSEDLDLACGGDNGKITLFIRVTLKRT